MAPTSRSPRTQRAPKAKLDYQPGLDGLRAVAVVAVMLYHAQQNMPTSWLPGGFLGVEVFFVISGYLITLLLMSEHQRTQRVDLRQFWVRRGRRLLPALYALLISTMAIVGIGGQFNESLREHVDDFLGTWASAWVYVTNWYQIGAGLNYADQNGRPPLVRHLWSLAVEEQFYLVWPLVMWFVLRAFGRRLPLVGLAFLATSLSITVYVAATYEATNIERVNFLYLATHTRASGLLLGAALAIFWRPWLVPHTRARHLGRRLDLLALVGLAVLAYTNWKWHFVVEGEDGPVGYDPLFQGGFLIVGLATVMVILATTHPGSFIGAKLLATQPLVWIGTRSYGLYLWHWPIFQLTRPRGDLTLLDPANPDVPWDWLPTLGFRLGLTVLVTEISYRLLETPIRTGALGRWWNRNKLSRHDQRPRVLAACGVGVLVLGVMPAAMAFRATDELAQQAECNRDPAACELLDETADAEGGGSRAGEGSSDGDSDSDSDPTVADDPVPVKVTSTPADSGDESGDASTDDAAGASTDDSTDDSDGSDDSGEPADTAAPATDPPVTEPLVDGDPGTVPASAVPPLAIGDSVMLGARGQLEDAGFQVDAKESRQFSKAAALVRQYRSEGRLGDVVVIALATNGPIKDSSVDTVMEELAEVPHVIFVTPQVNGKSWEEPNHEVLLRAPQRYANVSIVDWRDLAQDKLQFSYRAGGKNNAQELYFWKDKIHLAPAGQRYYAELIVNEVLRLGDA